MTREEIKNTPELVDFILDKCILADSRTKVRKRLEEICDLAIKALEKQPCEDAISRQAALDGLNDAVHEHNITDFDAVATILALPSVTPKQRWIPVTERLPEEDGRYLVCGAKGGI